MSQQDLPLAVIALATDADLESLPDGAPEIYWTSGPSMQEGSGAVQLYLHAEILSRANVTKLRFIGQWSVDGRTWYDMAGPLDGLASDSAGPDAGTCLAVPYAGLPQEYAPFQRFGISVTGSPLAEGLARQGRARLSAAVTILPWAYPAHQRLANAVVVTATESYATPSALIAPYRAALVVVDYADNAGEPSTAHIQVSPTAQGTPTNWQTLDTFTIPGTGDLVSRQVGQLYGFHLRVLVVAGTGGVTVGASVLLAR